MAERVGFVHLRGCAATADLILSAKASRRSSRCIVTRAEADGGEGGIRSISGSLPQDLKPNSQLQIPQNILKTTWFGTVPERLIDRLVEPTLFTRGSLNTGDLFDPFAI